MLSEKFLKDIWVRAILNVCQQKIQKLPFIFEDLLGSQDSVSAIGYCFNNLCAWKCEHVGVTSQAKPYECKYSELSLSVDCISKTLGHCKRAL